MPRVAKVSVEDAVQVIKDFAYHFENGLPAYTSQVWQDMSVQLQSKWKPHDIYTAVREDRRGIRSIAWRQLGISDGFGNCKAHYKAPSESSLSFHSENSEVMSSDCNNNECSTPSTKFNVILTEEEWNAICPKNVAEHGLRKKHSLAKGIWTNLISITIWKQLRLPCAFVYKRADVHLNEAEKKYNLKIKGQCRSTLCGNTISIYGEKAISEKGLVLTLNTSDTRNMYHEAVKRPLSGARRQQVQEELKIKGCVNWQNEQARQNMEAGDTVPPFIPNLEVLRNAKKQKNNADLNVLPQDGRDLIRTIEDLSLNAEYAGIIQAVGAKPFFVFYSSPAEMNAYKEFCRVHPGNATISLDSTGSLVKKLIRSDKSKSGHIFLYSIVVNFENTTLAVHQMLSEIHSTEFIAFWLMRWVRAGATKPDITVTDYSRALITGICIAFNNCTIKSYIESSFSSALQGNRSNHPKTLIRIDVAHLTHLVCRWKSFVPVRQKTIKEFYVRCVSLMVDAQTIIEFQQILSLTCAVGLQEYEDSTIDLYGAHSVKEARYELETFIATRKVSVNLVPTDESPGDDASDSETFNEICPFEGSDAEPTEPGTILAWVQQCKTKGEEIQCIGKNLNPFFLPDFIRQLLNLAKEFPLWTAATIPRNASHATSSYVETYFGDLKRRVLKNTPPPLRIDKFLKHHIHDIMGQTLIFSSKLINSSRKVLSNHGIMQRENATNGQNNVAPPSDKDIINNTADSDLLAQEDWRRKATHETDMKNNIVESDELPFDCTLDKSQLLDNTVTTSTKNAECDLHTVHVVKQKFVNNDQMECNGSNAKYYKPYSEVRQRNLLTASTKKPFLLPNGGLCKHPLKLDGHKVFVRSTCALDSLAHILMTAALDDSSYAAIIETSTNLLLQFISALIKNGTSPGLLTQRAQLLKSLGYPCNPEMRTGNRVLSYSIDAWDSISNTTKKALETYPSAYVEEICSGCEGKTYSVPYFTPNHKKIERAGFGILEQAIDFHADIYNVKCSRCHGKVTIHSELNANIIVDLDIRASTHRGIAERGLECRLQQLPASISFQVKEDVYATYRLIGVVTFVRHHFIAHCRRLTGVWQCYDDLANDVTRSNLNANVEPHLAIYLRQ